MGWAATAALSMLLVVFASTAQAHTCPPGMVYFTAVHKCGVCGAGTGINFNGTACVPCKTGTVWEASRCRCIEPDAIGNGWGGCTPCPSKQVPDPDHTSCSACKAGTTFQYGVCVKTQASPGIVPSTGILQSSPNLGPQGPGAIGAPVRGAPTAARPGGIR